MSSATNIWQKLEQFKSWKCSRIRLEPNPVQSQRKTSESSNSSNSQANCWRHVFRLSPTSSATWGISSENVAWGGSKMDRKTFEITASKLLDATWSRKFSHHGIQIRDGWISYAISESNHKGSLRPRHRTTLDPVGNNN